MLLESEVGIDAQNPISHLKRQVYFRYNPNSRNCKPHIVPGMRET